MDGVVVFALALAVGFALAAAAGRPSLRALWAAAAGLAGAALLAAAVRPGPGGPGWILLWQEGSFAASIHVGQLLGGVALAAGAAGWARRRRWRFPAALAAASVAALLPTAVLRGTESDDFAAEPPSAAAEIPTGGRTSR